MRDEVDTRSDLSRRAPMMKYGVARLPEDAPTSLGDNQGAPRQFDKHRRHPGAMPPGTLVPCPRRGLGKGESMSER